ncbi:MAG TPA: serine/threonine-protein kinase [Vicinamibacterales bacterium]|nr:serine/threonine-protein kinase [Vicinamibacterales bacterium]
MDAERFAVVKRILVTLEDLPEAARHAYLERACAGDEALRAEVESLMRDEEPAIMHTGGLADRLGSILADDRAPLGRHVGPFRLVGVLGEGGMGVVYHAEQTTPIRRDVALKLVPLGMDTARVLSRFESERQLLALMNHPYIAQALEAGAGEDGRPYFVMELVRGEPVTEYCAREKPPLAVRLKLFLQICEAVQHAHQRGIIHRDLKPSNVLLTKSGTELVPKIIDFGIAKAIGEHETRPILRTMAGQALGTPEYMSPEQAGLIEAGVDTRTDIYALGVMLYELVTGRRPYDLSTRTPIDLERALRTSPPASGFGDIDAVARMAMERVPDDRYSSVEQLADDVRRVLEHRPVRARTQTWRYRAVRFARRHAGGLTTAALVLLLVMSGAAGIIAQRNRALASEARAVSEAARARAEAEKASAVASFLTDLFRGSDPANTRGAAITARELLDRGAARLATELASQDAVRATLMDAIGVVYRGLGMTDESEKIATDALTIRRRLGSEGLDVAQSLEHLGEIARDRTQYDRAAGFHRDSLAIRRALLAGGDPAVAESLTSLGQDLRELGKYDEAVPLVQEAIAIRRERLGPEHSDTLTSVKVLGDIRDSSGKFTEAEQLYGEVLATRRRVLPPDHPLVASSIDDLAGVTSREGRYSDAEAMFREALAIRQKALDPDHPEVTATKVNLSRTLRNEGRLDESEPIMREALAADRRHFGNQHMSVAVDLNYLASILQDRGEYSETAKLYRESLAIRVALVGEVHPLVAVMLHNLGHVSSLQGRWDDAERWFRRAIDVRNQLGQQAHRQTGETIMQLGRVFEARGRFADAEQQYNTALGIQRAASPSGSPSTADVLESLGYLKVRQQQAAIGEPLIREALEFRRKSLPAGHKTITHDEIDLGECLAQQSRWAEAEPSLLSALKALPDAPGPATGMRKRAMDLLVKVYEQTGRPDEAAKYRGRD